MSLVSKLKKISILSVVALNTLVLSGGLTTNAMNPQCSIGSTSSVVPSSFSSVLGYALQSIRQLGGEPVIIFAPRSPFRSGEDIVVYIPQVVNSSNGTKVVEIPQKITLIGNLIPADAAEFISDSKRIKTLAYIPKEKCLSNESVYAYIPQIVNVGGRSSLIYVPQAVNLIGAPFNLLGRSISYDNKGSEIQNVELNTPPKTTVVSHKNPVVANSFMEQLRQYSEFLQKKRREAQVNQVKAHVAPLNSSVFSSIPSSVKFSNAVQKNQQPSVPSSSEQTKQTNCVTPEKNKLSEQEMSKIGSLAPRPVRHLSKLSCDEIRKFSRKLDFSKNELEKQNISAPSSSEQTKQTNCVTPEKNKLNLQKPVSKSNGVQKTTLQNSQKPISALHGEAKRMRRVEDGDKPIYIPLSDSQSDIETDIDTDIE